MEQLKIRLPKAAGGITLDVAVSSLPESIRWELIRHGLQQKVADACARTKEQPALTESEALTECQDVVKQLQNGTWSQRGGARVHTFSEWLEREAGKDADKRVKPGGKNAGQPVEKVKAALIAHDTYRSLMAGRWDAMQKVQNATSLEIEI